jgi:disulfide bond formation protein DsbB
MTESRRRPALILAASVAILGAAFAFQYWGGLAPCELCVYQRYPYGVTIVLALLALVLPEGKLRALALLACGLVFAIGCGIAIFHVGVEHHWWQGTAACTGNVDLDGTLSLEELEKRIMATPVVRCDRIAWSLFGISMAGYNALISFGLALWAFQGAQRERARRERDGASK